MDGVVVRDVVAIVAQRRGEEWHEPYCVDSQFLEVVELPFQPWKITDAIPIAVVESADVDLINDRVLIPKHIEVQWQIASSRTNFGASVQSTEYTSLVSVLGDNKASSEPGSGAV